MTIWSVLKLPKLRDLAPLIFRRGAEVQGFHSFGLSSIDFVVTTN